MEATAAGHGLDALPSSTHSALLFLRAEFAAQGPETQNLVLVTQLYSVISSCTTVDRELEQLRIDGVVRVFDLGASSADAAVMLEADYRALIARCAQESAAAAAVADDASASAAPPKRKRRRGESSAGGPPRANAYAMLERVLALYRGSSVDERALIDAFRKVASDVPQQRGVAGSGASAIQRLVERGLLAGSRAHSGYCFAIPNASDFICALRTGRAGLLKAVQRKRHKEISKDLLLRTPTGTTLLSNTFLLRDALGAHALVSLDAASGEVIAMPT
jgi:hypothetical protein